MVGRAPPAKGIAKYMLLRTIKPVALRCGLGLAVVLAGCSTTSTGVRADRAGKSRSRQPRVRRVVCLYNQRPWLNLDSAGDRDPEGVRYRIFLDAGAGSGVFRNGVFRVEMYRIDRKSADEIERTLVSDWEYPTSAFQRVQSNILGSGYHMRLRWARKDLAGHEIEMITQFKAPDGYIIRSATKRLHVPKYSS